MKIDTLLKTEDDNFFHSLYFYYNPNDEHIDEILKVLYLTEAQVIQLKSPYSVRKDHNNQSPIKNHIHLFKNGNNFLSMNQDGTAHDGMSGRIPNKIIKQLKQICPDYKFPENRIVEASNDNNDNVDWKLFIELVKLAENR